MPKNTVSLICIFVSLLFFVGPGVSMALDEEGCLTCHQYPGLVRLEKNGNFKPLHIDEEKYYASVHGKFRCKACHIAVSKVPHTGETKVDCTTQCHKGIDAKVLPANFSVAGFHEAEQSYLVRVDDDSSCTVCHPIYPHSKNNLVRAFLNLHTGYLFCEVCHAKREKFEKSTQDWKNTENAEFHGPPFGTYFNPHPMRTQEIEHFISRVALFSKENGKKRIFMNTRDKERAKRYLTEKPSLTRGEREQELAHFHRDTMKKEISTACSECHSTNSIMDFEKLGFSRRKAHDLEQLNIKGLVTKYQTFYLPNLFGN